MAHDKYIRFDWAAKKILRDKSNFCILEGLITVLLDEPIQIIELLEKETYLPDNSDIHDRIFFKTINAKNEIILVEIHTIRLLYFIECISFDVAASFTEHIQLGDKYDQVKKVYSISILYFDLGKGEDYVYRGQTVFRGVTKNDTLQITSKEKDVIHMKSPEEVFPEYYLIRVNAFNKLAENHLDEWIRYLKDGKIDENTTAPGLQEVQRKLEYMSMSKSDKLAYDEHINAVMIQNDVISTAMKEGRAEGRAEGIAEGEAKGRAESQHEIAQAMKANGMLPEMIATCTGLSLQEIEML